MAAQLGYRQRWATNALVFDSSWDDGKSIGSGTMAAVGHMGLASSFTYGVPKALGSLTLAMVGHKSPTAGFGISTDTLKALGTMSLPLRGRTTLVPAGFNTVDPKWMDPPLALLPVAHMGFVGTVSFANVQIKPLGAVTLTMVARTTLTTPAVSFGIRKALGALTLPMIGNFKPLGSLSTPAGPPFVMGAATMAMYGRSTLAGDTRAALPPHPLGALTLPLGGHATTTVVTLFSGGNRAMGSLSAQLAGRMTMRANVSYPGFDQQKEIRAVIDESTAQTISVRVDGDELSVQ